MTDNSEEQEAQFSLAIHPSEGPEERKAKTRKKYKEDNRILRRTLVRHTFLAMGIDEETIQENYLMRLSDDQMDQIKSDEF